MPNPQEDPTTGIYKTTHETCPMGATSPAACMFCPYGHMLECHYPLECQEAECSHWQQEMEDDKYCEEYIREEEPAKKEVKPAQGFGGGNK